MIGTLAVRAGAQGMDVIVVTGDRDSYQLVRDPHIKVLYNKRGVSDYALYDEAGILERTGVTPRQYVDYAALRGDKSDNLPGVPGIGEKTAAKLINTYGDLEGIFEHLDDLPPKQRTNLAEFHDQVLHNREMSVLRTDLDLDLDPDDLRMGGWDREAVQVLFEQLEFRLIYPRLLEAIGEEGEEAPKGESMDASVRSLRTSDEIVKHLRGIADSGGALRHRAALGQRRAAHLLAGHRGHRRGRRRGLRPRRRPARRVRGRPSWPRSSAPTVRRSSRTGPRSSCTG